MNTKSFTTFLVLVLLLAIKSNSETITHQARLLAAIDQYTNLRNWTRSLDGTGNNPNFTNWGSAGQPESRFCSNSYTDGIGAMRTDLPNPRNLSNAFGDINFSLNGTILLSKANWNMLFPIWGQFVEHDISLTKSASTQSIPIPVPKCDTWFDKSCTGTQTIPMRRSAFDPNQAVRSQINLVTAWLDGSQIYGSSNASASKLRSFSKGKLLTSPGNLLPKDASGYFIAGDVRVNENIGLIALHTLFLRQHNRLCDVILSKIPTLTDEQVYQMARNYVIGILQKITYDEYLVNLLGRTQYDAWISTYIYQDNINPDLYTEFNSAAFRIGHTQINSPYKLMDNSGNVLKTYSLGEIFQNPNLVTNETLPQIINGLLRVNAKQRTLEMVDDLRNFLTTSDFGSVKVDLFSTNVQRGRDHGICSLKKARDQLGLPDLSFVQIFDPPNTTVSKPGSKSAKMQSFYGSTNNVDLWVGIIGERALAGSDLGELGGKLVATQFRKIRNADKLWYEKVLAPYPDLLKEIKNTGLGDVIKRNSQVISVIQPSFKKII